MNTRHFATTRQTAVAGFISQKDKEITPYPPLRHRNQQGRVSSSKETRLLSHYQDDLPLRYSPRTVETYLRDIKAFLSWLSTRGLGLVEVTSSDLGAYQGELCGLTKPDGRPYSVEFHRGRVLAVRNLFRFLARRGYVLHDPAGALELPRRGRRLPRTILSEEEVSKMRRAVRRTRTVVALRDRAILETLYGTGIRVAELRNLTPGDVDTEEGILRVVLGKGGKDRTLPLLPRVAQAIEEYLVEARPKLLRVGKSKALFLANRGGVMQTATCNWIVQAWARRAGVKKHVTCHAFRHSVATHLLRRGVDIRYIQTLLGHASLQATEIYTRVDVQDLRAVLARAHPRGC